MGNLITDALVDMSNKHSTETAWADAAIAVWASGGIRSAIDKKPNRECSRKYGVSHKSVPLSCGRCRRAALSVISFLIQLSRLAST